VANEKAAGGGGLNWWGMFEKANEAGMESLAKQSISVGSDSPHRRKNAVNDE
jgi:hypothetical protein